MTDLTDRMRTCVAGLQSIEISIMLTDAQMEAIIDARALLALAAEELEKPIEDRLGSAMEIIKALPPAVQNDPVPRIEAAWYDHAIPDLPSVPLSKNACPKCDSRASKTVRVGKGRISLECPVCGHIWWR